MVKKIAIGADHGGFSLKERIKEAMKKARYKIDDVGTSSSEACDYPQFGFDVAEKVSTG
ncbi:RpiB/LacA/LacB family sugar-phosphate isomerase, partial [Candidatus Omnitrophota bacterium]